MNKKEIIQKIIDYNGSNFNLEVCTQTNKLIHSDTTKQTIKLISDICNISEMETLQFLQTIVVK